MTTEFTSVSTTFDYSIPIEEQLPLIRNAGFTHVSLGMNLDHSGILREDSLQDLMGFLSQNGLKVDTVHGSDLDSDDAIDVNSKIASAAARLGASVVVVHCSSFWFPDEAYDEKYKIVSRKISDLEKIAEREGIRFALENVVPGLPTKLCCEMVLFGDPRYIGFCYDSSHDQIDGPRDMALLSDMKSRVIAVHISDRIREFVDHVIPGEGFIKFDEMVPLLRESSFDGPLLMEVEITHSGYKDPAVFLKAAHAAATDLAARLR